MAGTAGILRAMVLCALQATAHAHGTLHRLMEVVDQKIKISPDDAGLWYQRAVLNLEHEDTDQAIDDVEKAESLSPGKLPTYLLKAQALTLAGRLPDAMTAIDAQILRFPEQSRGYSLRARMLLKTGATQDGIVDYRTALAKSPAAEPDLIHEAATAMAANGAVDEAIEVLDAGIHRLGAIPSLTMKLLEIEIQAGRYDAALARINAYQQSAPRPEPWMAKRAELLGQAQRIEESRASWQSLVTHLQELPAPERDCTAMSLLAARARDALTAISPPQSPLE
ncbi:MAG: tetratricopeptide repeat protein [Luteolibacter sp.]